jgi:hypothetical protein
MREARMEYINPYQNLGDGKWLKANFHTHAGTGPNTCGVNPLDAVIGLYRSAGYDILCVSNHDLLTDTSMFADAKLLMVPGVEYSQGEHMLTIGVDRSPHELPHQEAIDATNASGGLAILCHPHFFGRDFWREERLDALRGYAGIEVMNALIDRLGGAGRATDTWDLLLTKGRLVRGFGSDDFHAMFDVARSWNLVWTAERSWPAVRAAIQGGAHCVSTGLAPVGLSIEGDELVAKVKYPVETYVDRFTYRFVGEEGRVLSVQEDTHGRYRLRGERYVRVEALAENGAMLFFQPVVREGAF